MIQATRDVTIRDFFIFQLKLLIDGFKDLVLLNLSAIAVLLDIVSGKGKRPRLFYSVLRTSERFDLWLNLNGALERLESGEVGDDGLFGASRAGSDSLLGELEQMVRGGDQPRSRRGARAERGEPEPPVHAEPSDTPDRGDRTARSARSPGRGRSARTRKAEPALL